MKTQKRFLVVVFTGIVAVWMAASFLVKNPFASPNETAIYPDQQTVPLGATHEKVSKILDSRVSADLAKDGSERIHIVWKTDEGFYHTVNEPNSLRWEKSTPLPISPASLLSNGEPRLLAIGNQLLLFYGPSLKRLTGATDEKGQVVWRNLPPLLKDGPQEYERTNNFDIDQGSQGVVIATVEHSGNADGHFLNVRISSPDGQNFTKETIFTQPGRLDPIAKPSVLVSGNNIHLLWAVAEQRIANSVYHFYSTNFGKTWTHEEMNIGNVGRGRIITQLKMLQSGDDLQAFYVGRGALYMQSKKAVGSAWSSPTPLAQGNMLTLLTGVSGPQSRILWVDDRFRGIEWWGKIPFIQAVVWDTSPKWGNNDILMLNPRQDAVEPQRLTPPLSYTNGLWPLSIDNNIIYILRAGRAKVGKRLDSFGAKPELYIQKLETLTKESRS